jgi:fructosamine-3-kinase
VVIDTAVYYGIPEVDLAWVDAFEEVKSDLFEGYQQEQTIDPGFWERRGLWQVCGFLSAVTVQGPCHLERLNRALQSHV